MTSFHSLSYCAMPSCLYYVYCHTRQPTAVVKHQLLSIRIKHESSANTLSSYILKQQGTNAWQISSSQGWVAHLQSQYVEVDSGARDFQSFPELGFMARPCLKNQQVKLSIFLQIFVPWPRLKCWFISLKMWEINLKKNWTIWNLDSM